MLKKRLIGVVTVKDGWAVQSFGYRRYLPLGRPEVLVQNLDRWGVDEILVQCIDRSFGRLGPDLKVLGNIGKQAINTPLIYAGGINCRDDAVKVVSRGADRIMVGAMLLDSPDSLENLARDLGTQAVIGHLSVRMTDDCLRIMDYRDRRELPLAKWLDRLPQTWISELMVTDWQNEGSPCRFDERLLDISRDIDKPLLCFGGLSDASQIQRVLQHPQVVAVGVGNFLSHKEHAAQLIKQKICSIDIRPAYFQGQE
jgi:cyclase